MEPLIRLSIIEKSYEAGTIIIQVTHSERNAAYGSRIIQSRDGWLVQESKAGAPIPAAVA